MKILNRDLKLRQQLIVLFLVFAIIPSAIITVITLNSNTTTLNESKNELESLQLKTLAGLGDQYSDIVNNWVHEETKTADVITQDPLIRTNIQLLSDVNLEKNALHQMFKLFGTWADSSDTIQEMILLNYTTGNVIISHEVNDQNTTSSQISADFFIGAKSTQGSSLQEDTIFFREPKLSAEGNFEMYFSHVIRPITSDTANPTAVLVIKVDPNVLWNIVAPRDTNNQPLNSYYSNIGLGQTGEIYLINSQGLAISRSRFDLIDKDFILKQDYSAVNGFKTAKDNGYILGKATDYMGHKIYGAYVYLGVNTLSTDSRDAFLKNRLDYDLKWVLAIEIDQSEVLIPINHLQDQLNTSLLFILGIIVTIAIVVVIISIFIANTFSKPISKLSTISKSIAAGDLTVDIEKTKKTDEIGELQNSFETMTAFLKPSIESISDVAKTLAASAQEMASSSEEVNASSEEMSSVSQQISKGAQQQSEYLNSSMRQMEDIQKQFSDKIGGIKIASELIESISTQVNMLALNASIEAARAGEYGRGFAVVADNIRRLADDAKSSVDRVNVIIEDLSTTISNGMKSLNESVINVTTVAEETASGAEEASAATEEQAATMEELSASAQELAKVSVDLEEIVRRFKID